MSTKRFSYLLGVCTLFSIFLQANKLVGESVPLINQNGKEHFSKKVTHIYKKNFGTLITNAGKVVREKLKTSPSEIKSDPLSEKNNMKITDIPPSQMGLILDLILLFLILLGAFRGYKNGFISQIFSSVAILIFFISGSQLFNEVLKVIKYSLPNLDEGASNFLSMGLLCMTVLFFIFIFEKILKRILYLTFLGFFDSILGALLGIAQTIFFLALLISLLEAYGFELPKIYTDHMTLYHTIHSLVPKCISLLKYYLPKLLES